MSGTDQRKRQSRSDRVGQGYGRDRVRGRRFQEKPTIYYASLPVPQTDTGIRDEYSKARELTLPKELGKLTPYLR